MRIWRLVPVTDKKYSDILPTKEFFDNDDIMNYWYFDIGKTPNDQNYKPVEVYKKNKSKKLFNIPYFFNRVLIIDEKAKAVFEPFLNDSNIEILPLICKDTQLHIINILDRFEPEDVLDMEKSTVKRFTSGRIMYVSRYYFEEPKVSGKHIFTVIGWMLCDDEFKNAVESNGLTGLEFKLVYRSEEE